jgi:hypothetical protein
MEKLLNQVHLVVKMGKVCLFLNEEHLNQVFLIEAEKVFIIFQNWENPKISSVLEEKMKKNFLE